MPDGPFSEDDVRRIYADANNAGHFAFILTKRMFAELFGPTNIRFHYNWHGNGPRQKKELDPARKATATGLFLSNHLGARSIWCLHSHQSQREVEARREENKETSYQARDSKWCSISNPNNPDWRTCFQFRHPTQRDPIDLSWASGLSGTVIL